MPIHTFAAGQILAPGSQSNFEQALMKEALTGTIDIFADSQMPIHTFAASSQKHPGQILALKL